MAYELVRLAADGEVLGLTTLEEPATTPDTDFGPTDPRPLFLGRGDVLAASAGPTQASSPPAPPAGIAGKAA